MNDTARGVLIVSITLSLYVITGIRQINSMKDMVNRWDIVNILFYFYSIGRDGNRHRAAWLSHGALGDIEARFIIKKQIECVVLVVVYFFAVNIVLFILDFIV